MQKITIAEVNPKSTKTGGTFYMITDSKGAKFSGFGSELGTYKAGDIIEADIEVDGKYTNIKASHLVQSGPATLPKDPLPAERESYKADPAKIISMERQAAARIAFEFGINTSPDGIWTMREALKSAEAIYQWIANGTMPPATQPKAEPDKAPAETPESKKAFDDIKSAGTKNEELPPMTHIGDLLNWAYKLKPSVSSLEVCKIAGVKDATQITNYQAIAQKILEARKVKGEAPQGGIK